MWKILYENIIWKILEVIWIKNSKNYLNMCNNICINDQSSFGEDIIEFLKFEFKEWYLIIIFIKFPSNLLTINRELCDKIVSETAKKSQCWKISIHEACIHIKVIFHNNESYRKKQISSWKKTIGSKYFNYNSMNFCHWIELFQFFLGPHKFWW